MILTNAKSRFFQKFFLYYLFDEGLNRKKWLHFPDGVKGIIDSESGNEINLMDGMLKSPRAKI